VSRASQTLVFYFFYCMKSRLVVEVLVLLISDRLCESASFVLCRRSTRSSSESFISLSLQEWQHFPSSNSTIIDERGCDAFVTTLDINDEGKLIIDPIIWARTFKQLCSRNDDSKSVLTAAHPPIETINAIESTRRWSENFVRKLKLCPWAGSSIDVPGGIRYWVVLVRDNGCGDNDLSDNEDNKRGRRAKEREAKRRAAILHQMECIVRDAGRHLMQITATPSSKEGEYNNAFDAIDPSVAIAFVILVEQRSLPFVDFHEYFIDLEEKLLDECDIYWDDDDETSQEEEEQEDEDGHSNGDDIPIGCDITVAAFHPKWRFSQDGNSDHEKAVDFEKRAPYPTISIVRSSAIDALMNDDDVVIDRSAPATRRIAYQNEKTLRDIGLEKLRELFDAVVIKEPP
jgi:hypothetical protein